MKNLDEDTIDLEAGIHRSFRQAIKAITRGDYKSADRWTDMLERQLFCATRVDGMHKRTHRRRPLSPLPKKSETDRIIRNGVEYNPIPEREKQQLAQARALRWLAHLAKLGVKPRASLPDGEGPSTQTTTPAHLRLGL